MKEKTISSRTTYEGRMLKVRIDTVLTVDGRQSTREIVERSNCIAVIALNASGKVLLENQYRQAVEKELLEIPAGAVDPGENPEQAVIREMQEETGFRPQHVVKLGGFYASPGYSTEYLYLYLATDLVNDPLEAEDTAGIEVVPVDVSEIPNLIATGKVQDGKSVAGLLYYLEYRRHNPA
jgi:ADP-ribose pyrophosphatase